MASSPTLEKKYLSSDDLTPGLKFEYLVDANKGLFGDFPDRRFPFELHGRWLVAAFIASQETNGWKAFFDVFEDEEHREESLMGVTGTILPRPTGPNLSPEHYGTHPIEVGFATLIDKPLINNQEPEEGLRYVIPARNIHEGTLSLTAE